MKRKKWSEKEEETLLNKYSDLQNSGTLSKLKTREKKFKPIADHVNSIHHLLDPVTYPFRWSWRDVSIKVQNMRHQYLGVKQKIRGVGGGGDFDWDDGVHHWDNFLLYKGVFGDVELDRKAGPTCGGEFSSNCDGWDELGLGLGLGFDCDDGFDEEELEEEEEEEKAGSSSRRRMAMLGARVLELRDVLVKREGKRREREFAREEGTILKEAGTRGIEGLVSKEAGMREIEDLRGVEELEMGWKRRDEGSIAREEGTVLKEAGMREMEGLMGVEELGELEMRWKKREFEGEEGTILKEAGTREIEGVRGVELEELEMRRARREFERELRVGREIEEERRWRRKMEERREEEEMEWRERMLGLQLEHEKQMMQMHADACQSQMQMLGVMARLMCQFFGSPGDGGLGGLHPQVLQNLQHPGPGDLGDSGKPGSDSPPEFM